MIASSLVRERKRCILLQPLVILSYFFVLTALRTYGNTECKYTHLEKIEELFTILMWSLHEVHVNVHVVSADYAQQSL
jgi:hypothetical protein